jgi:uncharacterized protein YjbI with pentapeptide repeats
VSLRRADLTGAVLNKSVLDDADARDACWTTRIS